MSCEKHGKCVTIGKLFLIHPDYMKYQGVSMLLDLYYLLIVKSCDLLYNFHHLIRLISESANSAVIVKRCCMEVIFMKSSPASEDVRQKTFERLMRDYEVAVLRTCFLYLSDRHLAEDALQDTFLKVWRNLHQFERRNGCTEKSWIMRIAINTCKDYKRSAWLRLFNNTKSIEDLSTLPIPIESHELLEDVLSMPEKYKQVVVLYYYQNMTLEEAAKMLGMSRPTFTKRLKKACELLRNQLRTEELP